MIPSELTIPRADRTGIFFAGFCRFLSGFAKPAAFRSRSASFTEIIDFSLKNCYTKEKLH